MQSLQCARAIAALFVVYFHTTLQIVLLSQGSVRLPVFGECGVDVFFVLSGFLMWSSTRSGSYSAMLFYKKRVARIAPLYWLVTLTATAAALLIPSLLNSTQFDISHVLASLAFVPWPNPASSTSSGVVLTPVIVPGWTLNFEIMFYIIFGLALLGPRKGRLARLAVLFSAFAGVVIVFGPTLFVLQFYNPFLIAEFLLGIAICVGTDHDVRLPTRAAVMVLVVTLVGMLALEIASVPGSRFFSLGLPSAVIIFCLVSIEKSGAWPNTPWLAKLGDASFSIYLTHVFVLAGLRTFWTRAIPHFEFDVPMVFFLGCGMVASGLFGLLVYDFVERPLGRWTNRALGLQR